MNIDDVPNIDISCYEPFITDETRSSQFFNHPGIEHYRLLCHLSTLYNNTYFITLSDDQGYSGLALSFNPTNKVIIFDRYDEVDNAHIKNKANILIYQDNPFGQLSLYKDLFIQSTIILLNIDMAFGDLEYHVYQFLVKHQYQGIVVCDGIKYNDKIINNFWNRVEHQNDDVTAVGHWKGTGVVNLKNLK